MSAVTLDFTSLPNENPYTLPTEWLSVGQLPFRISSGVITGTGAANSIIVYDRVPTGLLTSSVVLGTMATESLGIAFCSSAGTGYQLLLRSFDARLFKVVAGVLGSQVGSTYSGTFALNDVVLGTLDTGTGGFVFSKNGSQFATFTDTTYSSGLRAGIHSRATTAPIKSVTVSDYNLQLITSINGGNPITAGQTGIAIEATGLTAKPTAVTATYASGTKSITATIDSGGTATNFNISIQDRIEAEDWPVSGDTITFAFTYLSERAVGTQTLVKKASETVLTVSGGITSDPATWTYWLTQDGFTVEGGEHDYIPYGDLVLTADGGGSATNAGTFTSWFRPATGTGAGNVYAYTWVITEAGISPAGSGLTSSGLTVSGLTIAGLTSSGL